MGGGGWGGNSDYEGGGARTLLPLFLFLSRICSTPLLLSLPCFPLLSHVPMARPGHLSRHFKPPVCHQFLVSQIRLQKERIFLVLFVSREIVHFPFRELIYLLFTPIRTTFSNLPKSFGLTTFVKCVVWSGQWQITIKPTRNMNSSTLLELPQISSILLCVFVARVQARWGQGCSEAVCSVEEKRRLQGDGDGIQ